MACPFRKSLLMIFRPLHCCSTRQVWTVRRLTACKRTGMTIPGAIRLSSTTSSIPSLLHIPGSTQQVACSARVHPLLLSCRFSLSALSFRLCDLSVPASPHRVLPQQVSNMSFMYKVSSRKRRLSSCLRLSQTSGYAAYSA